MEASASALHSFIQIFPLFLSPSVSLSLSISPCDTHAHINTHLRHLVLCHSIKGIGDIQPQAQDDILSCSVKTLFYREENRWIDR